MSWALLLEPFGYAYMTNAMWVATLVGAVCWAGAHAAPAVPTAIVGAIGPISPGTGDCAGRAG